MSIISDIYNIAQPNNPQAQIAEANAQANLAAIQLAQQQAGQSSTVPTWAIIMSVVAVLGIIAGVVIYIKRKKA